ncbi:unnamed protein product [Medioppia subpectinata]|uniref:Nose resistant-to-fluoxetine protein N-terminal domain-containing protein n=1 Tax=Medioppia subpectinata TaxID=1979941 RepID=A0A7R9KG30_9ACAR|nr:unnamed protein product [Medioppia subpectinata]CAG2102715.1 unnamed protein product [Medioppia subpectinata]
MKRVAPRLSEFLFYIDLPSDCMTALARVGQAIRAQETWAFRFLDSSPIGKMDLTSLPFGEYDECLDIESRYQWDKPMIYGQYCALGLPLSIIPPSGSHTAEDNRRNDAMLLNYMRQRANSTEERTPQKDFMDRLNNETDGHLMEGLMRYIEYLGEEEVRLPPGICLPTACNAKDFEFAINKILYPFTHFSISINPDCDYKDKPISIDKYQITSIVMLSLMGTICIICTIIYLIRSTETSDKPVADGKPTARVFQVTDCFAIVPNFVSIFDMRSKPNRLSAVDGVRAVLCFWMFIQHEYDMGYLPFQHKRTSQSAPYDFHTSLRYIFLINWNLTDTFFLMAGPLWPLISHILQKPCIESPMSTIFMVNNYISFPNLVTCVPATWYASTYFQLCLLAPFVVLILYYAPTIGILWSLVVISFGSFLSISPKLIAGIPHFFESYKSLSIDTVVSSVGHHLWGIETHVQLYVLGLLFGYLTKRHPNMYLGGIFGELAIWLTTWAMTFYAIFWHRNYFNFEEYSVTESEITHWILWSKLCYGAGWA